MHRCGKCINLLMFSALPETSFAWDKQTERAAANFVFRCHVADKSGCGRKPKISSLSGVLNHIDELHPKL